MIRAKEAKSRRRRRGGIRLERQTYLDYDYGAEACLVNYVS